MSERLRLLLDTNILIPLEDSLLVLEANLASLTKLAAAGGHILCYHPASIDDINRDDDIGRKERTLSRLQKYTCLKDVPPSPSNTSSTSPNDACDNNILHALVCSAVHALVTEDRSLHAKAKQIGIEKQVYTIQTAEDWLRRLHEPSSVTLPNIQSLPLYALTPKLPSLFFNSLRDGYGEFDSWFKSKAKEGRNAWVVVGQDNLVEAICIYTEQSNEVVNDAGDQIPNKSLKLCTFKVGESVRGQKIGELFLKAAFRYATENHCENIFIHGNRSQEYLFDLLLDFGFTQRGVYRNDLVFIKEHPPKPPNELLAPLEYVRRYFPHYRDDSDIGKFIIPIRPEFHKILFPELEKQGSLFRSGPTAGNAIKQAYLCHSPNNQVRSGDIALFYRTHDLRAITSLGVVESLEVMDEPGRIMQRVSRRTVYSQKAIEKMAGKPTKVMLFRLVKHCDAPFDFNKLKKSNVIKGPIQSIMRISEDAFARVREQAGW